VSTPFNLQGNLNLPGQPGLSTDPILFGILSQYDSKQVSEYVLPSTPGTQAVNFGTLPSVGVKAYLLIYVADPSCPPPIMVTRNAGTEAEEVSNGGFICGGNPNPSAGLTSLSIAFTQAGRVQVWLLG